MHVFFSLSESVTQEKSQNLSILGSGGWRRSTDILLLIGMFHYLSPVWEDGGFGGGGGVTPDQSSPFVGQNDNDFR